MNILKKYLVVLFLLINSICNAQYIDYVLNASWVNEPVRTTFVYSTGAGISQSSAAVLDMLTTRFNNNSSIKVSVRWNPAFVGTVVISAYFTRNGPCCELSGASEATCGVGTCMSETKTQSVTLGCPTLAFQISSPSAQNHAISYQPSMSIDGGSLPNTTYQWYERKPGDANALPVSGATGVSYLPTIAMVGDHFYYCIGSTTGCGQRQSNSLMFKGLPTCASNVPIVSISPALTPVGTAGALQVSKGVTYTLNISGVTDFDQHYNVTNDGQSDITYNNTSKTFVVNRDLGSYAFTISTKTDGVDRSTCPNFQPISLWATGGQNTIIDSKCLVILPDQICQYFNLKCSNPVDPATDYILNHFTFSVISSRGIIVKAGVVLKQGARLKLNPVLELADSPAEAKKNYTSIKSFDDEGRVIEQSRSYFDDKGRNVQTQSKSLSKGIILAAENKYDVYDRLGVTTLAAPVSAVHTTPLSGCSTDVIDPVIDMPFEYKTNFVINSDATEYNFKNFDLDKEYNPDQVDGSTPGTLAWYYSNNNSSASTSAFREDGVAVNPYPYARTLYRNDGTNRVIASTQPGDQYKAGSDKYGSNDVIKFADAVALTADAELVDYLKVRNEKVFPSDANLPTDNIQRPVAAKLLGQVAVNTSKDMNGLQSFEYVDQNGQTLMAILKDENDVVLSRSYTFYNDIGQTVCTVTPNGVQQLIDGINFGKIDKTTFEYDSRGRLTSTSNNDAGISHFIYRLDGTLRFSQNAEQAIAKAAIPAVGTTPAVPAKIPSFSYINYDEVGRPFESGEFTPASDSPYTWKADANGKITASEELIDAAEIGGTNEYLSTGGAKSEKHTTHYDEADINVLDGQFTIGNIAWIEKDNGAQTHYSYDERGRVIKTVQVIPILGNKTIEYTYHPNGQVKEVAYQAAEVWDVNTTYNINDIVLYNGHHFSAKYKTTGDIPGSVAWTDLGVADAFYHVYAYDADGRMVKVWTGKTKPDYDSKNEPYRLNNQTASSWGTVQAEYIYYLHGPLKQTKIAGFQNIDYTYTAQGLLKAINNPQSLGTDMFAEQLEYFSGDYASTGSIISSPTSGLPASRFDGLPVATVWRITKPDGSDDHAGYKYTYDNKYQLADAQYGIMSGTSFNATDDKYREGSLTYDDNGNMLTINRYNGNATPGLIHDFTGTGKFQYDYMKAQGALYNNRMLTAPGYAEYSYNSIGQMTGQKMLPANVQRDFAYNASGLTANILTDSKILIGYTYDASGKLLVKKNYDKDNHTLANTTYYVRDANGTVMGIYAIMPGEAKIKLKEQPVYGSNRLGSVYYSYSLNETPTGSHVMYELKDHLGSVRAQFSIKQNNTREINSYASYYPFGLPHTVTSNAPRYGYQGEYAENIDEIKQNFFELRLYDPVVGRWNSMDPKDEFYSPYEGMGNNPVTWADPDGGGLWKPDVDDENNPIMIKEAGDDVKTLERDYGKDMADMYKDKIGNLKEGESFKLDRGFTAQAFYQWNNHKDGFLGIGEEQYNCFEFAASYSKKKLPQFNWMDEMDFESTLKQGYVQGGAMVPRQTVLGMMDNRTESGGLEYSHAAVFFGYDKARNAYYITKNGELDLSIKPYKYLNSMYQPQRIEFWNLK